jgi:CheY-like chemotaxis protein
MLPHVFDMFTQVNRTLNRAQGGLGIGLTLARNLVQLHGGRIEVHSEGPGRGSEFVVRLPLAEGSTRKRRRRLLHAMSDSSPAPARRRILVVDDMCDAALTLARLLEAMGHEVRTAPNAAEALVIARSQRPDLVLSDIAMPRMDGYELARRLRQEPELGGAVLVALTGFGQESDRQRAHEAGFDSHLVKPVKLDALEALLASLPAPRGDVSPV